MEIRSQSFPLQPLEQVGIERNTGGGSRTGTPASPGQNDVASLSFGQALSGDDTRVSRVAAVQSQITNGTYHVSAGEVASKLLSSLSEGS